MPREKNRAFDLLFGKWSVTVAWVILAGVVFLPPRGLNVELCMFKAVHGHPCPGCGLSRSVCNLVRGNFGLALTYHPFGFLVLPFSVMAASRLFWTRSFVTRVQKQMAVREILVFRVANIALVLFLAFGLARYLSSAFAYWKTF